MSEITLNTSDLKKSVSNVRKGHTKEDIHIMANSIKARGIINPPTVAKSNGKYEIVAGQLRVAGAIAAGLKEIRCVDVTDTDTEERVAVSLSENLVRRQMSAIELYRAFSKLFKEGKSVEDIAKEFSHDIARVQQILAIGSLPVKILDLVEHGEIGDRTLEALAIAPRSDVTRYTKLKASERPSDWGIKQWLQGEHGWYRLEAAFFDPELYDGPTVKDLFDEDAVWCTDGEKWKQLQETAITSEIDKLKELGWKVTQITYFSSYDYDKANKKNGGEIFYTISDRTGAVEFHKGYKRKGRTGPTPAAKDEKIEKPEISKAFENFMDETRHAAVQRHMLDDKRAGLVGTLILLLRQCDNVRFSSGGKQLSDAYNDSLHSSDNFIIMKDDFDEMLDELSLKDGHTWQMDIAKTGAKLMEYTPATLTRWIITTMVRNWDCCEAKHGDAIGKATGLTQVNAWEADDAFWDGIKNKKTLIAIAKENKIDVNKDATTKNIRATLKEKVSDEWRPKWLKF